MRCLFKQACGIGADVYAMCGGLAAQFRLNLGLDVNDDRHRRRLSRFIAVCPAVYRRPPLTVTPGRELPVPSMPLPADPVNSEYSDLPICGQGRRSARCALPECV